MVFPRYGFLMSVHRDRHGRGIRGPLALPNPLTRRPVNFPSAPKPAQYFSACLLESVHRIEQTCPKALLGVDVGVDEVPTAELNYNVNDSVPLAAALQADRGQPAKIVLFRRPLERRSTSRNELKSLIHTTLVEQLAALTGFSMHTIDPKLDD